VGTIARQLGVHHTTVDRALNKSGIVKESRTRKGSLIDPYLPFILMTLEKFPKLTSARLYDMVVERGYPGGSDHFRHLVSLHRPRKVPEAYHRLQTLPGEVGQVDWGHFGTVRIGNAERKLMAFVIVLAWSRQIFLRFYPDAGMANFLRGHVGAFEAWQGLPKVLWYDNLKSAVLERQGDAIRFHPTLLQLAGHYRYEPRPVAVARGNEKGRVERAIRYIRSNFFAARQWRDLDDLNAQADEWCWNKAAGRRCPEDKAMTVGEAFEKERSSLIALPGDAFPTEDRVEVSIGKTPYARFDLNDYSVPHTQVQKSLLVSATQYQVRILDGTDVVAVHARTYDKGLQIEDPDHIETLTQEKRQARQHRGQNRLTKAVPISNELLVRAGDRGDNLRLITRNLLQLLDTYGSQELEAGIGEALDEDVPHHNAVRLCLERRREERDLPPPLPVKLPAIDRVRNLVVKTHALQGYDSINNPNDNNKAEQ